MLFQVGQGGTALDGALSFFDRLGVFTIILPFLLVFTIVYAILEKTKVYGLETIDGNQVTRKNLNAMTAFVVAFFVIASSRLVAIISETLAWSVLVLILIMAFMLLTGAFHSGNQEYVLDNKWKPWFMGIVAVAIMLIFLNAMGWLETSWNYLRYNWDSTAVASLGLAIFLIAFIVWVTKTPGNGSESSEE